MDICLCVYVCVDICLCGTSVCGDICLCVCVCAYACVWTSVCVYVCVDICLYACVWTSVCIRVCGHLSVCVCVDIDLSCVYVRLCMCPSVCCVFMRVRGHVCPRACGHVRASVCHYNFEMLMCTIFILTIIVQFEMVIQYIMIWKVWYRGCAIAS